MTNLLLEKEIFTFFKQERMRTKPGDAKHDFGSGHLDDAAHFTTASGDTKVLIMAAIK